MYNSTFKQKSLEAIKASQQEKKEKKLLILKNSIKSPQTSKSQGINKVLSPYKKRLKKIKAELPKWLKAIPESTAHGSGTYEKRLWKITSDFVRIRDWYTYNQNSVDGKWLESWQQGQAGHYISYSICKNMFKFNINNIHLQSANSNQLSSASDGHKYGKELEKRYGKGFVEGLHSENIKHAEITYTDKDVEKSIIELLKDFERLEERPEYVRRSLELYNIQD